MNWQNTLLHPLEVETATDEQIFSAIRFWRNKELSRCDWTQLPDSTADKAAWAAYRQELRDLPAQNSDPKQIVFPVRPT